MATVTEWYHAGSSSSCSLEHLGIQSTHWKPLPCWVITIIYFPLGMRNRWSGTDLSIYTQGKRGTNISADLHIEHLNRVCKEAVDHLGANKTPKAGKRIGSIVGIISSTLDHYDKVTGIDHGSHRYTRSDREDLNLVLKELLESKVFTYSKGRKHKEFDVKFLIQLIEQNSAHG